MRQVIMDAQGLQHCRRHFEMLSLRENVCIATEIPLKFVPLGAFVNTSEKLRNYISLCRI